MANNVEYILSLRDLFTTKMQAAISETEKLDKAMGNVNSSGSKLGGTFGNLKGIIATLGLGLFAKDVFEVGSSFESYQMGLKTFLKTNEAAAEAFAGIKEDAEKTPFGVDGLFKGNMALVSAGESAKVARENVLGLANAIAATGGGDDELQRMVFNLQQIKNTGIATGADIKQFGYAGINIYGALAASTGKTTEQVKEMKFTYEEVTKALNMAGKEGGIFEGAMANAMNTTKGKFSNLKDSITFLEEKIFNSFKGTINSSMDGISKLIEGVSLGIDYLKGNIVSLQGIFQPLIDVVVYTWDTIKGVFESFNLEVMFNTWANALGALFYILKPFAIILVETLSVAAKIIIGMANAIAGIVLAVGKLLGYQEKNIGSGFKEGTEIDMGGGRSTIADKLKKSVDLGGGGGGGGGNKPTGLDSKASQVSGSKPTSIVINVGKLVETQNFHGAVENMKNLAPNVRDEMIKIFLSMLNDSQQLAAV